MAGQATYATAATIEAEHLNANFKALETQYTHLIPASAFSNTYTRIPASALLNGYQHVAMNSVAINATAFDAVGDSIPLGAVPSPLGGNNPAEDSSPLYTLFSVNCACSSAIAGGPDSATAAGLFKIKYGNPLDGFIDVVQNIPLPRSADDYYLNFLPGAQISAKRELPQFLVAEVTEAANVAYSAGQLSLTLNFLHVHGLVGYH